MTIQKGAQRFYLVTAANNGDIIELGPAGSTAGMNGTFDIEFAPDQNFTGSFRLLGKVLGQAALTAPYVPIPYKRVNMTVGSVNQAGDFLVVADDIVPTAIIRVSAGQLSIGLLVTCTLGTCQVYSYDGQGGMDS